MAVMTSADTAAAAAGLPEHVRVNREHWDATADHWAGAGEPSWAHDSPAWGVFQVPQSEVPFLPDDVDGLDAIELGCGAGYVSAWLARRGARPVGIDNSEAQLTTARRLQAEHNLEFPLLHGNAERVPYPDASFDLAVSEYGAAIRCEPYAWIPEAGAAASSRRAPFLPGQQRALDPLCVGRFRLFEVDRAGGDLQPPSRHGQPRRATISGSSRRSGYGVPSAACIALCGRRVAWTSISATAT
jgi:SAM-dependent methyltransferase